MKSFLSILWVAVATSLFAQIPADYYQPAQNLHGYALRVALHQIIQNHTEEDYGELWADFYTTDARPDGKVWDIYSDNPNGQTPYLYNFGTNQCGNYNSEGDCYNREHSVPQSWFKGAAPMYTDLFHLYPTDGWVNNKRGNLPFGKVGNATWTSLNGSKVGSCATPGYSGQVFEPIDAYKGDLARSYFYMAVCYMDKNMGYDQSMFEGGSLKPWALQMLLSWHALDPVSQKEIDRNNAVYAIQLNRNPFIDYPELVNMIFGSDTMQPFVTDVHGYAFAHCSVYPNPATDYVQVTVSDYEETFHCSLVSLTGQILWTSTSAHGGEALTVPLDCLPRGLYLLHLYNDHHGAVQKIIKQ